MFVLNNKQHIFPDAGRIIFRKYELVKRVLFLSLYVPGVMLPSRYLYVHVGNTYMNI